MTFTITALFFFVVGILVGVFVSTYNKTLVKWTPTKLGNPGRPKNLGFEEYLVKLDAYASSSILLWDGANWIAYTGDDMTDRVVAWMPLPKYKEDKHEQNG